MKKLVYPLSYDNRELLLGFELFSNDEIVFVLLNKRHEQSEKIEQFLRKNNINIVSDYREALLETDEIYLLGGADVAEYIKLIQLARVGNKKIFALNEVREKLMESESLDDIKIFPPKAKMKPGTEILPISVPVIAIMGIGCYCDKFLSELNFRKYYIDKGYKILQFASKEIASLFGVENVPDYVSDVSIPLTERVKAFNNYVVERIQKENPDIIIIGVSDGIMPINNAILNNFGDSAMAICNALFVDYAVVGIYHEEHVKKEYLDYIQQLLKFKFDTEVLAFCLSNTVCEVSAESFGKSVKYFHLDYDGGYRTQNNWDYSVEFYNVHMKDRMNSVIQRSIDLLSENIEEFI